MSNYYLEHHQGTYYLLPEGRSPSVATFTTQQGGIEYAKEHYPPPHHGLHVERVEYIKTGQPPQWRKVH